MARTSRPINANEEEQQRLQELAAVSPSRPALSTRAQVVLLSMEGRTLDDIMQRTGLSRSSVVKWRDRFRELGLKGLQDAPRSGRKRSLTKAQLSGLLAYTPMPYDRSTPKHSRSWVAAELGVAPATVHRHFKAMQRLYTGTFGLSQSIGTGSHPSSFAHIHRLIGVFLADGIRVFAIGQERISRSGPGAYIADSWSTGSFLPRPFGAALTDRLDAPWYAGHRNHDLLDAEEFIQGVDKRFRRMRIIVHVHSSAPITEVPLFHTVKRKRRIVVHHVSGYGAWLEVFRCWLHTSPEPLTDRKRWRNWEAYVDHLTSRVREFESARLPAFSWFHG